LTDFLPVADYHSTHPGSAVPVEAYSGEICSADVSAEVVSLIAAFESEPDVA